VMDVPIVFTPKEVIDTVLAICGAIITISAAFTVIYKIIAKSKEPDKLQNERLDALEKDNAELHRDIAQILDRLKLGNKRFESDAEKMEEMKSNMKESINVIIKSLLALTAHAIDGNNTAELKKASGELKDYLIER